MRFIEKKFLYIIIYILWANVSLAQQTLIPKILLTETKGTQTKHLFYAFEKKAVGLYNITSPQEYEKIWEYRFLTKKNIELVSSMYGDITGNGLKELIIIAYSFGQKPEIYVFSTYNNIPNSPPEIYTLPNLLVGTTPIQAELLLWDLDKDYEIALSLSSPERKIIILDYAINTLKPTTTIAKKFMLNTYGPTRFQIHDYNNDNIDDIVILSNSEEPSLYNVISNQEEYNRPILLKGSGLRDLHIIKYKNQIDEIGITKTGEIFSISKNSIMERQRKDPISRIITSDAQNIFVITQKNQFVLYNINAEAQLVPSQTINLPLQGKPEDAQYVTNKEKTAILITNSITTGIALIIIGEPITVQLLNQTRKEKKEKTQETEEQKHQPQKHPKRDLTQEQTNNIIKHDTLFINTEETIQLDIINNNNNNIHSVETTNRPEGIILDPTELKFHWTPTQEQTGIHPFEYLITYNLDPVLETKTTPDQQLSLNSIVEQTQEEHQYIIYVNDKPQIIFYPKEDTIRPPGTFRAKYTIIDQYQRQPQRLLFLGSKPQTLLINKNNISWQAKKQDAGQKRFYFSLNDGLQADTAYIDVYVDTTTQKIVHNKVLIATAGKEFLYSLKHDQAEQNYTVIDGPENLWISPKGTIHWIPLLTQLDNNKIIIETSTTSTNIQHIFNIYVNYSPLISYRPAAQEFIIKGDTFTFNLQSFDMNIDAQLFWEGSIEQQHTLEIIDSTGSLQIATTQLIDNIFYKIQLTDRIDNDTFFGTLYSNDIPQIVSKPKSYIELGNTLLYTITAIDENEEKPFNPKEKNQLMYSLVEAPKEATLNAEGRLMWEPTKEQIGKNNFIISVSDSLESVQQRFSIFVNDKPNIISLDSLSIQVGDTLTHLFDVQDLNKNSDLIYNIKTTINELLFSGKQGKLTWIPSQEDIGLHALEINVSDGFSLSEDTQKLKIFVYDLPKLTTTPPTEAYVNVPYVYFPKGTDMFSDTLYNQDIFITIANEDPLWTGNHNQNTNELVWIPTLEEAGEQKLTVNIADKYVHSATQDFVIQVLISPCETEEKNTPQIIEKPINTNTKKEKRWRPKQFSPFSND